MIRFLDLHSQYLSIREDIDAAIAEIIGSSSYIGGAVLANFEQEFAKYQRSRHCVGVGNGTDAIEIAIEALDLPPDSEIIVPANSFIASSEAVTRAGHRVVFCDVNLDNYTIDVFDLEKRITNSTSAIMAVHLYGHPADMGALSIIARENGLRIIEDCAQAHGAVWDGQQVGTIGDIGTFSFYPGKNLGAYGDGGAIVTNSDELEESCRMIANHGRLAKYDHEFEGRNSRLDTLQAAILKVKLKYLEDWTEHRISIADRYLAGLQDLDNIILPVRSSNVRQVYHLFVIRCNSRDMLREYLSSVEVQTGIHYPTALPNLKAYRHSGQTESCPSASAAADQVLSLPIGEHMTMSDVDVVIGHIRQWSQSQQKTAAAAR